jgi:lysine 2,3-aminomutase
MFHFMTEPQWKSQLSRRIASVKDLTDGFTFTSDERKIFEDRHDRISPSLLVTPYFFGLADPADPGDPLRKQFMPTAYELHSKVYETGDPLDEKEFEVAPLLVHRYANRVLFRATTLCAIHCRYCFRRAFLGARKYIATGTEIEAIVRYISSHSEVEEILISGGDPLVLDDDALHAIVLPIRRARKDIMIRLCTRVLSVLPHRITNSLVGFLIDCAPIRVVTQFNHPNEITGRSRHAVSKLVESGISVLAQTVLLKGINDNPHCLSRLFSELVGMHVKPYYLFQGDLACGTSHFRVPLGKGISIYSALEKMATVPGLPVYAVDLPKGGGKVPIRAPFLEKRKGDWYIFKNSDGKEYRYPAE